MKKTAIYLLMIFGLLACNDFLDVNTDPNSPTSTTPNFLLPSIISNGMQIQGFTTLRTVYITQHLASRAANPGDANQFYLTTANSTPTFNNTYFLVGSNIPPMIEQAAKEGSPYYVGAGKIMMAMIMGHLTDMMGDVPLRDAFKGYANITPRYDAQEFIYDSLQKMLDEGIVEMSKPASANFRSFAPVTGIGGGDILYGGNTQRWIRLAYALKARYANHLSKKSSYNPQKVLEFVEKGFASSADDAQLQFVPVSSTVLSSTNIAGRTRGNYNNATFSRHFMDYLNGATLLGNPAAPDDPRIKAMATPNNPGAIPGSGGGVPATGNTDFYNTWYARDLGYLEIISFAELKFIEAEAAFRAGDRARAFTAYRAGITAHINKVGRGDNTVSPAIPAITNDEREAYLASAAVAQTATSLSLRNIMEQKYIALFMNPETWVDMRRHDFSREIYLNLQLPTSPNPATQGEFPRRLLPAQTETISNPGEVSKVGGNELQYIIKKMWIDLP